MTNGRQWIVFRGLAADHRGWTAFSAVLFSAVLFNGEDDLVQNYGEFWSLLAKDRVIAGSLSERLDAEAPPPPPFAARPNTELGTKGSLRAASPAAGRDAQLFFDHYFDDIVTRDNGEMLRQCYVEDVDIREYDRELRGLLTDQWSALSADLGAEELTEERLRKVIADPKPSQTASVVLLVGRVGAGKSTFLHRFFGQLETGETDERHARFVLDLVSDGQAATTPRPDEPERVSQRILEQVSNRYGRKQGFGPEFDPYADATLRTMFGAVVHRVKEGPLKRAYEANPTRLDVDIGEALAERAKDAVELLPAYMNYVANRTKRPFCLVFDNLDRATDAYQRFVYAFAHNLAQRVRGVIVISLRESTYWKARHQGFLDTRVADVVLQLSPPNLKSVISRRLKYLDGHVEDPKLAQPAVRPMLAGWRQRGDFLRDMLLREDDSGRRVLTCLANRSVRRAFFLLREYGKYPHAWKFAGGETPGIHLLTGLMLGRNKVFEADSPVFNLFRVSERVRGSHYLAALILSYLERVRDDGSQLTAAVAVADVYSDFEAWGYARQLIAIALSQLAAGFLVETDSRTIAPPGEPENVRDLDAPAVDVGDQVRLSPAGVAYLRDLWPSPVYRALCAGSTFWYSEAKVAAFLGDYEAALSLADGENGTASLLLASAAPVVWEEYLADEWRREERVLAAGHPVGWRQNVLQRLRLPAVPPPAASGARSPSSRAGQVALPFVGEPPPAARIEEHVRSMPTLLEKSAVDGEVFLARVLWVLELCRRAGAPSQSSADIARLCLDHGGVHAQDTNTARFFRDERESGVDRGLWETEGRPRRLRYRITVAGCRKFAEAFGVPTSPGGGA